MHFLVLVLLGIALSGCSKDDSNTTSKPLVTLKTDAHYVQQFGADLATEHSDLMLDYENKNTIAADRLEKFCDDLEGEPIAAGEKLVPAVLNLHPNNRRISYCEIAGKGTTIANCARNVKLRDNILSYTSPKELEVSVKLRQEEDVIYLDQTTINGKPAEWPTGTDVLIAMPEPKFKALQHAVYSCLNLP